jgi:hypothetical protein
MGKQSRSSHSLGELYARKVIQCLHFEPIHHSLKIRQTTLLRFYNFGRSPTEIQPFAAALLEPGSS